MRQEKWVKYIVSWEKVPREKIPLFKKILGDESLSLKTIVPYTTRPVRAGEKNGVEYFFCDEKKVEELEREGRIIELRAYDTIHGIWKYFYRE